MRIFLGYRIYTDIDNIVQNLIATALFTLFGINFKWELAALFVFFYICYKIYYGDISVKYTPVNRSNIVRQICLEEHIAYLESSPYSIQQIESLCSKTVLIP